MAAPFWLEVLKLLVPFAVAILAIWAKEWYVAKNERRLLMRLLLKELTTQLGMLTDVLAAFGRIPEKLRSDGFCVFVSQMTEWYFPTAHRLAQLDPAHAFAYGNFSSLARHVEASSQNLQRLLNDALATTESKKATYISAVEKNSRGLQDDFLAYAESCAHVLEALSKGLGREVPDEVLFKARESITRARKQLGRDAK